MAATAALGFQIVILLSAGSFQAVLPAVSPKVSPVYPDDARGVQAFMDWLVPQYPKGRWNPPPTQICVVGVEPFAKDRTLYLPQPLHASKPPFRVLEPYRATFHYIGQAEQAMGVKRRSAGDALKLCGMQASAQGTSTRPAR